MSCVCSISQNVQIHAICRFTVADRINEYRGTGGVRIEDDVIVHANHTELMSVVPRNVHTIINVVVLYVA